MNDIVLDLIVDGEQQSDISKVVHLSPGDSIFEESSFQNSYGDSTVKRFQSLKKLIQFIHSSI